MTKDERHGFPGALPRQSPTNESHWREKLREVELKDFKGDHEKNLRLAMEELVGSGVEGGFVIFETEGDKALEFTYSHQDGLTLDMPRLGLSTEERERLKGLEGLETLKEDEVSYHVQVGVDTRVGARLAHRIFREVFGCPASYRVRVTLDA